MRKAAVNEFGENRDTRRGLHSLSPQRRPPRHARPRRSTAILHSVAPSAAGAARLGGGAAGGGPADSTPAHASSIGGLQRDQKRIARRRAGSSRAAELSSRPRRAPSASVPSLVVSCCVVSGRRPLHDRIVTRPPLPSLPPPPSAPASRTRPRTVRAVVTAVRPPKGGHTAITTAQTVCEFWLVRTSRHRLHVWGTTGVELIRGSTRLKRGSGLPRVAVASDVIGT